MESCAQCDREFKSLQGLRGHQQMVHAGNRSNRDRPLPSSPALASLKQLEEVVTAQVGRILIRASDDNRDDPTRVWDRTIAGLDLNEVGVRQFGGLADRVLESVIERFRPLLEEKVRELAAPVLAELADLRRRVDALEGG